MQFLDQIGGSALAFKPAFRAALGGISNATFHRHLNAGQIPKPDAYVGKRPAWKISTIEATINGLSVHVDDLEAV